MQNLIHAYKQTDDTAWVCNLNWYIMLGHTKTINIYIYIYTYIYTMAYETLPNCTLAVKLAVPLNIKQLSSLKTIILQNHGKINLLMNQLELSTNSNLEFRENSK